MSFMSRDKTGSELFVGLLSQLLTAGLAVILLRGFGCLPSWSLSCDLLLVGSAVLLFHSLCQPWCSRVSRRKAWSEEGTLIGADHASQALLHLSHEIRSPMNALVGYARLLKNGEFRDEIDRQKQLEIIHASGVRLLELVDRVLQHAKLENGRDPICLRDSCLFSMLVETAELFQLPAAEKGLALQLEAGGPLPTKLNTDPQKFQQLLSNLVANAINFTSAGSVHLCAEMNKMEGQDWLEIRVVDSGVGIPADQIERVFAPFAQLPAEPGRFSNGVGLGLTISRQLAGQLGGTLEVSSVVGEGTVFTFRMSCECPPGERLTYQQFQKGRESAARRPVRNETNRLSGMQVMIVDDDSSHRRLFQLYLEQRGATTLQATNGMEALRGIEKHKVDLLLVDMQMPVMDGIETTVQLRQRGFRKPIIGISAQAEASPGCEERELGFSGWLQKPIDSETLDRLLARLFPARLVTIPSENKFAAAHDGVKGPMAPLALTVQLPEMGTLKGGNHSGLRRLAHPAHPIESGQATAIPGLHPNLGRPHQAIDRPAQTDHSSWSADVQGIEEFGPLFLETLRNKLDDIRKSSLEERWIALRQFAHWLKGTAPTCGFGEFSQSVTALEMALQSQCEASGNSTLLEIEVIAESLGKFVTS